MPDDPTGTYFLPPSYKVVTGDDVLPTQHNPPLEDLGQAMSNRLHRDGRTAWTGDQNANGNKLTGLAEGTEDDDAATVGQSAVVIGDFKRSARNLGENWLRLDGKLYDKADYPELGAILPTLPDGVAWSNVVSGISGGTPIGMVITDDGFFVAVNQGSGEAATIWKSATGDNYSLIATVPGIVPLSFSHQGGAFILSGIGADVVGKVAVSIDATTWGNPVSPGIGNTVFDCSFNGALYVAVGNDGKIASSPDLVTWTPRASGTTNSLRSVNHFNDTFLITGFGGVVISSPNGETFTLRSTGTTDNYFASAWGGGLYVVVGNNGKIITSANLTSWQARSSGTTQALNDVVSSTSGLMAVGGGGTARISSNAQTWTATVTGVSSALSTIAVNPNAQHEYYVLGGGSLLKGVRTLPTQFRVPSDDPTYGWIRAK